MRHIILRPRGGSWFVWDRGDRVGMRLGGWGHIGWLVRHWSHCELLTCVVDVFVALFMVGHLKFDEIEGTYDGTYLVHMYVLCLASGIRRMRDQT